MLAIAARPLTTTYGFSDDYSVLGDANASRLHGYDIQLVSFGRPLYALFIHLGFGSISSISDLVFLRWAGTVGLGVLAWMLCCVLMRNKFGLGAALVIPLIVCTMPAFEVWGSWADCFPFAWGAVLGVAAALVGERAISDGVPRDRRIVAGAYSFALLLCSVFVYQSACMVFVAAAGVYVLAAARDRSVRDVARIAAYYVVATVAAVGIDGVVAKVLPRLLYGTVVSDERTQIVSDGVDKVTWFFRQPLRNALNLWDLTPSSYLGLGVAVVIAVGLYLFVSGSRAERLLKLLVAAVLIPVSYLPSLLVAQDAASYRIQAGLGALLAIYLSIAIVAICQCSFTQIRHRRKNDRTKLALGALVALGLIGIAWDISNVWRYMVVPQRQELAYMRAQLNQPALATATSVYVIPCSPSTSVVSVHRYDEFGVASCGNTWSSGPMAHLLMAQMAPAFAKLPVVVAPSFDNADPPAGSLVVDMRHLS